MNEMERWTLAKGYRLISNEEGFPPAYINRKDIAETFEFHDRNFFIIDECFGYMLSQTLARMIKTRQPPIDVLDVGGGTLSLAAREIAQRHPDTTRVINIDVAISTNSQNTQNFHSLCEDACKMSIHNNSIDLVYSWEMMPGLNKNRREQVLGEIARVLKPEGVALLGEEDFCGFPSSDPQLEQLSNSLSFSVLLKRGNFTKSVKVGNKYTNTNQFLMLMKPPIDPSIVAMTERNAA